MKFSLYMILAMFLWAGGWSALKILTLSLPVEILTFWRFLIMSLAFIPILLYIKLPLRLPKQSLKLICLSTLLNVAFMIFAFWGVEASTAGSGGVIITVLSPIFTFVLSILIFKSVYMKQQYFALVIGIVGGVVMVNVQDLSGFFDTGEFYFMLCALCWAGVTLLAQQSQGQIHAIHYSFFIAVLATLVLFVLTLGQELSVVFSYGLDFWSPLLYLGILAQTVATTIYFVASRELGSSKASSYMFLVPVFALLIGYVVLDEAIQWHVVYGGAISLISVYMMNKKWA